MRTTLVLLLALLAAGERLDAQAPALEPESLVYRARSSRFGVMGRASMWVEPAAPVKGAPVARARFEFSARVGFFTVEDRATSWITGVGAGGLAAIRYTKRERSPLGTRDEDVSIDLEQRRWRDRDGRSGALETSQPLDELSFIYFVRALPADTARMLLVDRHFDAARHPVRVTILGRDTLDTPAGRFRVLGVEMRVRDPRYRGEGIIRFDLSDDSCRLPVRIRSSVPLAGTSTLTLESYRHHAPSCDARLDAALPRVTTVAGLLSGISPARRPGFPTKNHRFSD